MVTAHNFNVLNGAGLLLITHGTTSWGNECNFLSDTRGAAL